MTWDKLKKQLIKKVEFQIQEMPPPLDEIKKKVVLEAFEVYLAEQLEKPVEERKFYIDDYGGTVYTVQFPKKSFVALRIAAEPKIAQNGTIQWWGLRLPLLVGINGDDKVPIATVFMPNTWDVNVMWEPEDEDRLVILRGNASFKYSWLNDTAYPRFENVFLKEAREKFENDSIQSIDDILTNKQYKSSMDKIKPTLNPNQSLKVI